MISDRSLQKKFQRALCDRLQCETDAKGYVRAPIDNLIEGVFMENFEEDVRGGDGDELRMKFCAAHSSTALAVNSFAWFKPANRLPLLCLLNTIGANDLKFERQFRIFRGGRHPNLDVWIERDHENVAIESKLTEYFVKKRAEFSEAYDRLSPPGLSEPCWWQVYEQAKGAEPRYLDIAQLVKHYFGLRKYQQSFESPKKLWFLYLFWEPLNWREIQACNEHRKELEQLAKCVSASTISFNWMTYLDLWNRWSDFPALAQHSENLKARYLQSTTVAGCPKQ